MFFAIRQDTLPCPVPQDRPPPGANGERRRSPRAGRVPTRGHATRAGSRPGERGTHQRTTTDRNECPPCCPPRNRGPGHAVVGAKQEVGGEKSRSVRPHQGSTSRRVSAGPPPDGTGAARPRPLAPV